MCYKTVYGYYLGHVKNIDDDDVYDDDDDDDDDVLLRRHRSIQFESLGKYEVFGRLCLHVGNPTCNK